MLNIAVKNAHAGCTASKGYDVNASVLMHYAGNFRRRLEPFKSLGFVNAQNLAVHVMLIASEGDGEFADEILAGWPPGYDVTLLEMSSAHPIPKINGAYLWLAQSSLRARWQLRVDDDSSTDLAGLLAFANLHFGNAPVHLMASPLPLEPHAAAYSEYLARTGVTTRVAHEYEGCLSSQAAFERVFGDRTAMEMLAESGRLLTQPGRPRPRCCHAPRRCAGGRVRGNVECVPANGDVDGRGPLLARALRELGRLAVHEHARAFVAGTRVPVSSKVLARVAGKELPFGRCIGASLNGLTLHEDGRVAGGQPHEVRWRQSGNLLLLLDPTVWHRPFSTASFPMIERAG